LGRPGGDSNLKSGDNNTMNWLDEVKWDAQGLVPVIAQEQGSNDVLMFAWMNREALHPPGLRQRRGAAQGDPAWP